MPSWFLWWAVAEALQPPFFVGVNKYSHDASVCVVDGAGKVVFAGSKERLSRVKHDGGAVGDLVRHALGDIGDVAVVAQNNHHSSIARDEAAYVEADSLGIEPRIDHVLDPANLLSDCRKRLEVSHHLAHAYGALLTPLDEDHDERPESAVIVVLDGMGELRSRMDDVISDAGLNGWDQCRHILGSTAVTIDDVPGDARECESVYTVSDQQLRPVWKRWCVGRSSEPFGYADWFLSPLDSFGAAYSYVSHVIFGDWNACGKVMGLAPWGDHKGIDVDAVEQQAGDLIVVPTTVWDGGFFVDRSATRRILHAAWERLPEIQREALALESGGEFPPATLANLWNRFDDPDAARTCCAVLAAIVQRQLEKAAIPFIQRARADAKCLYVTGGVALNSVMNGKLGSVVVPSAPGDEGIALGCAAVAYHSSSSSEEEKKNIDASLLPFSGSDDNINVEDDEDDPLVVEWLEELEEDDVIEACAKGIVEDGAIVFWYEGRSEFGPRALGHRSILASAADKDIMDYINKYVKRREEFRPLAPAILHEAAAEVFEDASTSPYMAKVWRVKPEARSSLAACTHVDGTARPQTVGKRPDLRRYRELLERVGQLSNGPPVVLDTSFNTKAAEPIVETPRGAISSFVHAASRRPDTRPYLLAFPEKLFRPAECPVLENGTFPTADTSRPWRRHDLFDISKDRISVFDLDEPFEDASATGRGDFFFAPPLNDDDRDDDTSFSSEEHIDALVYRLCDGDETAADLAAAYDNEFSPARRRHDERHPVYESLRRLWLASLVGLRTSLDIDDEN